MPKITAAYLNDRIKSVKNALGDDDYTAVTELHYIQEQFAGIIKPYNVKDAGKFRSYNEVNKYRKTFAKKKGLKYTPISKNDYQKQLTKFYDKYNERLYVKPERNRIRQGYIDTYDDFIGEIDVSRFSYNDLKDAFKAALEKMEKGKRAKDDSGQFFANVQVEIEKIYNDKYREDE